MTELLVERSAACVTLTMNRPDRLNAVTAGLYAALIQALDQASHDPQVRAVVLTGAGRAFCVGADLKNHGEGAPDDAAKRRYAQAGQDAALAIMRCDKPVIGAVNGHAIGAGLELALACDLTIVAETAKLRFPELLLGTFVGGGTTFTLVERVGMSKAKELLLLGRFFTGADAAAWGLCNVAAPVGEIAERAATMAEEASAAAPRSVAFAKQLLRAARERTLERALAAEADALAACMGTKDWQEGLDAFRDKRPPRFTGE
ncbi:MAG: enoyl-CoA hydratase/isomerase family protein [Planctomycetes bacterium]|nr:enoyl-CoA hydratase/isomerase family protein [Planctomycetota bacterium]